MQCYRTDLLDTSCCLAVKDDLAGALLRPATLPARACHGLQSFMAVLSADRPLPTSVSTSPP